MNTILLLLLVIFVITICITILLIVLSKHFKLYDTLDERKVHNGNIPRLGGVAIFIGFFTGLIVYMQKTNLDSFLGPKIWFLFTASFLIFIMGLLDDLKPWRARYKLLVQVISALIILSMDFTFHSLTIIKPQLVLNFGIFRYFITFCWIIGVTNSVNLIDGIDGLAGIISASACAVFAFFFYAQGNIEASIYCVLLLVCISAFLVFNLPFPKARIFMGDGGSQFLGFMLAVLPLLPNSKQLASIKLPFAAGVLLIPIFDTIAAFWRRTREKRSFFDPDKFHLHHKMLMLGFSKRESLFWISFLQAIICLMVVSSFKTEGLKSFIVLMSVYLIGILFFSVIHIRKEEILEKSRKLEA